MKVFVTGGTGFVGKHVVERLIEDGYVVKALARSEAAMQILRSSAVEPVLGNLGNIYKWKKALEGCDAVVHCAAPVEFWGPWSKFEDEIAIATKMLCEAAAQAGVRKLIHISSEAVLQDRLELLDIDEDYAYPSRPNSLYGVAKKQAEIELLRTQVPMDIIILRPTFVWGAQAPALYDIAAKVKAGSFVWVDNGRSAFEAVHVKNLAEAVILAITRGKGKEVYFVTDDELATVRSFFSDYFRSIALEHSIRSVPGSLTRRAAHFVEAVWRVLNIKRPPPLSRFAWSFVAMPRRYNISKIKTELGYRPIVSRMQGFTEIFQDRN